MSTTTAERSSKTPRTKDSRSDRQVRVDRAAATGRFVTTCVAAAAVGAGWLLRRTWRRLLPAYWAAVTLAASWIGVTWTVPAATIALVVVAVAAIAAGWPARSWPVRLYRTVVAGMLGLFTVVTVAADAPAAHPTLTVFGPCLAATLLGWPWWHHLRHQPQQPRNEQENTPQQNLTQYWAGRWQSEVVEQGVATGTRLVHAHQPRPGVTEAVIRLKPGTRSKAILATGSDVEVALDLDDGAVGWRRTGKAAKLGLVLVEQSYIADGVAFPGPTYDTGRCQLTTFTDGTPGWWVFYRPGFGTLNGLVVGSTGAGKSRALGVLITNLLHARWMVAIGDPQNGQSLPAWREAVGEYHQGVDAVRLFIRRLYNEVMARSDLLSTVGVEVFDDADPRVQKLGLAKLAAIIDECQMVLIAGDKDLIALVEDMVAICRKTGVLIIFATQIPQMRSLGGSIRIRDALVAGNAFIMRLSNRGSGTTVLPDDFVGDPFALPKETNGKTTAGMGYLRDAPQLGMLSRVPMLHEAEAAAATPRTPLQWQVPEIDPDTPMPKLTQRTATATANTNTSDAGAAAKLRAAFGIGIRPKVAITLKQTPAPSTPEWVLACLRRAPASAQALADRPDCPVRDKQLYAVLDRLAAAGRITKPAKRGDPYTLVSRQVSGSKIVG